MAKVKCSVEGCEGLSYSKGMCRPHWWRMFKYGRLEKVNVWVRGGTICEVDGCDKRSKGYNLCRNHLRIQQVYGMHPNEYYKKLKEQNNCCAICEEKEITLLNGKIKQLAVDHCHKTNKIRDLLCWRCNSILGRVNEDINLLAKMITYLQKHA